MIKFAAHPVAGGPTLDYLVQELEGGQPLLAGLANTVRRESGSCLIYAPSGIPLNRLLVNQRSPLAFEQPAVGAKQPGAMHLSAEFESTQHLIASGALERLVAWPKRLAIVEDQIDVRQFP